MFGTEGGWGMGIGMWIFWIVVIVLVVALGKMMSATTGGASTHSDKSPMELLKARFARGEIDEAEFNRRRHELEK